MSRLLPLLLIPLLLGGNLPVAGAALYNPRQDLLSTGDPLLAGIFRDPTEAAIWFGEIYTYSDIHTLTVNSSGQGLLINRALGPGSLYCSVDRGGDDSAGCDRSWWSVGGGYGYGMADLNVGVLFSHHRLSDSEGSPEGEQSVVGLGMDLYPRDSWDLDLALEYRRLNYSHAGEERSGSTITLRARGGHFWRDLVTLVPLLEYCRGDRTPIDGSSATELGLGLGLDWRVSSPLHLYLACSRRTLSLDFNFAPYDTLPGGIPLSDRDDRYSISPTVVMGIEYRLLGVILRAGSGGSWTSRARDGGAPVKTEHWNLQLGAGVNLNRFQIDLALNPDWLYDFGHWNGDRSPSVPIGLDPAPEVGGSAFRVPPTMGGAPVFTLQVKYFR